MVLRGQAFGWDNWWPQYYNAEVVRWLRDDWCVDVVRPAMGIEPDGAYLKNPSASKQRMTTVVEAAIDAGVYVIIDWHAHNLHQAEAVAFFGEMAERYGKNPHVLYEIFNEPEKDETWQQVKDYATAVIGAIRKHDPDNIVIVGSPEWDQRIDTVAADPLKEQTNVVYSVHFYAGTHKQWLRDRTKAAIGAGIPVFVSESSGAEASGQGQNDYAEWKAWIDFMEQNRVSWLNYSVSDKAGETISVLKPGARASGRLDRRRAHRIRSVRAQVTENALPVGAGSQADHVRAVRRGTFPSCRRRRGRGCGNETSTFLAGHRSALRASASRGAEHRWCP